MTSRESPERWVTELIRAAFPLEGTVTPSAPRLDPAEWEQAVNAAIQHGLAPLLFRSLQQLNCSSQVPVEALGQLQRRYLRSNTGNLLAYAELARLLDLLGRANVPLILLKGGALAQTLYPDFGLRPLGDLDLLIRPQDIKTMRSLLTAQGYAPVPEMELGFEENFSGEQSFSRLKPIPSQVDVHWHLFVIAYYRRHIPIAWFWQRTHEINIEGWPVQIFTPTAQLLHLSAHYSLHHHGERLVWLYDLALLLSRSPTEMDWGELLDAVRAFKLVGPVHSTLEKVRAWWGVSLPDDVRLRFARLRPGLDERVIFFVAANEHAEARVLLDGLYMPGCGAKLYLLFRHAFPTLTYIRARYQVHHEYLVPLYYFWRIGRGGYRVIGSLGTAILRLFKRQSSQRPSLH